MIRIERVNWVPEEVLRQLAPYSALEVERAGEQFRAIVLRSMEVWAVYDEETPLLVVGLLPAGLLGYPNLWFLMTTHYRLRYLRKSRTFIRELVHRYRGLKTEIEDEFRLGKAFARFMGFTKTSINIQILGRTYHTYEVN